MQIGAFGEVGGVGAGSSSQEWTSDGRISDSPNVLRLFSETPTPEGGVPPGDLTANHPSSNHPIIPPIVPLT